jgi:hypothetical protein
MNKEGASARGANTDDRLTAAMEYARAKLTNDHACELVFQCNPRTGKKLSTARILSDVDFDKLWGADFEEHLSEEDLERTYLRIKNVEAERVMIDEAIKYLHEPGLKLPTDRIEVIIQELIIGILEDHKRRISRKRGRKAEVNSLRDRYIAKVVKGVCEFGFDPTRNPATNRECGCSIVAEVLASGGLKIKEQAVAKIWGNSGQTIP